MSKLLLDTNPHELLFNLLRSDAHVSVNKALMFAIGVNEALVFSELLSRQAYFDERGQLDENGCFYNTVDDLRSGTCLSDYQQRAAIANLKKLELIDVLLKGSPPKRYFKIITDPVILVNLLHQGKHDAKNARKPFKNHNSQETSESILKKLDTNKNNINNVMNADAQNDQTELSPETINHLIHLHRAQAFLNESKRQRRQRLTSVDTGPQYA